MASPVKNTSMDSAPRCLMKKITTLGRNFADKVSPASDFFILKVKAVVFPADRPQIPAVVT